MWNALIPLSQRDCGKPYSNFITSHLARAHKQIVSVKWKQNNSKKSRPPLNSRTPIRKTKTNADPAQIQSKHKSSNHQYHTSSTHMSLNTPDIPAAAAITALADKSLDSRTHTALAWVTDPTLSVPFLQNSIYSPASAVTAG